MRYAGIADCYGIESFIPIEKANITILELRAIANDQRHAVVYTTEVDQKEIDTINALLSSNDYIRALLALKLTNVELTEPRMERSWDLIPNPKLDPWR